jgi:hypothetical protein
VAAVEASAKSIGREAALQARWVCDFAARTATTTTSRLPLGDHAVGSGPEAKSTPSESGDGCAASQGSGGDADAHAHADADDAALGTRQYGVDGGTYVEDTTLLSTGEQRLDDVGQSAGGADGAGAGGDCAQEQEHCAHDRALDSMEHGTPHRPDTELSSSRLHHSTIVMPPRPTIAHVLDMMPAPSDGKRRSKEAKAMATGVRAVMKLHEGEALAKAAGADAATLRAAMSSAPLNAFGFWRDEEMHGSGVYPAASVFNHSCLPNVAYRHEGEALCFYCVSPVRSGDPLTISYVDLTLPTAERRRLLLDHWGFWCECPRCSLIAVGDKDNDNDDDDDDGDDDDAAQVDTYSVQERALRDTVTAFDESNVCSCGTVLVPRTNHQAEKIPLECHCDEDTRLAVSVDGDDDAVETPPM